MQVLCPNCGRKMSVIVHKKDYSKFTVFCSLECRDAYKEIDEDGKKIETIDDRFEIMDF